MKIKCRTNNLIIIAIIIFASISRLVPHPPNFTPILAIALFSGFQIKNRLLALSIPLVSMYISDIVLGYHITILWVYSSLFIISFIGVILSKYQSITSFILGLFSSSLIFFIVTNFGVWLTSTFYEPNIAGLLNCYIAGIPFYTNTMLSTFIYGIIFYVTFKLSKSIFPEPVSVYKTNK
tara:strand:- start:576 stop:1112 length:537 start_codon:yes stop_codon:yes gene_type:complete